MFEYIKGIVVELNPAYAVTECGGIGYLTHISVSTYSALTAKTEQLIYIHEIIREDTHVLYGFTSKAEREIFRQLITVSGVGANTARMLLSSFQPNDLCNAITNGDINAIKAVKGIGIKTAQRLVVDLKDKLGKSTADDLMLLTPNANREEALSALVMLGFAKKEVEKVLDKITKEDKGLSVEDLVKKSLKNL